MSTKVSLDLVAACIDTDYADPIADSALAHAVEFHGQGGVVVAVPGLADQHYYTVTAWVRPEALQAKNRHPEVVLAGVTSAGHGWELLIDGRFKLATGDGTGMRVSYTNAATQRWPEVDHWMHVAVHVTCQDAGSEVVRVFVDGVYLFSTNTEHTHSVTLGGISELAVGHSPIERHDAMPFRGRIAAVDVHLGGLDWEELPGGIRALKNFDDLRAQTAPDLGRAQVGCHLYMDEVDYSTAPLEVMDFSGNGRTLRLPEGGGLGGDEVGLHTRLPAGAVSRIDVPALFVANNEKSRGVRASAMVRYVGGGDTFQALLSSGPGPNGTYAAWSLQVGKGQLKVVISVDGTRSRIWEFVHPTTLPVSSWTTIGMTLSFSGDVGALRLYIGENAQRPTDTVPKVAIPDEPGLFVGDASGDTAIRIRDLRVDHDYDQELFGVVGNSAQELSRRAWPTGLKWLRRPADPASDGVRLLVPMSGRRPFFDPRAGHPSGEPSSGWSKPIGEDIAGDCLVMPWYDDFESFRVGVQCPGALAQRGEGNWALGVSAWLRLADDGSSGAGVVMHATSDMVEDPVCWRLVLCGNTLSVRFTDGGTVLETSLNAPGAWAHICLAFDQQTPDNPSTTVRLWVDGVMAAEEDAAVDIRPAGQGTLFVGPDSANKPPRVMLAHGLRVFERAPDARMIAIAMAEDAPEALDQARTPLASASLTPEELNDDTLDFVPDAWFGSTLSVRSSRGAHMHEVALEPLLPVMVDAEGVFTAVWSVTTWIRPTALLLDSDYHWLRVYPGHPDGSFDLLVKFDSGHRPMIRIARAENREGIELRLDKDSPCLREDSWTHVAFSVMIHSASDNTGDERAPVVFGQMWLNGHPYRFTVDSSAEELRGLISQLEGQEPVVQGPVGPCGHLMSKNTRFAEMKVWGCMLTDALVSETLHAVTVRTYRSPAELFAQPIADLPLDQVLVKYEREQLGDVSGHDHPGLLHGQASALEDRAMGMALDLPGGADSGYIELNRMFLCKNTVGGRDASIEVWVKPFVAVAKGPTPVLSTTSWLYGTPQDGFRVMAGSRVVLQHHSKDGEWIDAVTAPGMANGRWSHIAMVLEFDSLRVRLFVDGVAVGACPIPEGHLGYPNYQFVRAGSLDPANAFSGRLAYLRVYHRALPEDEVASAFFERSPGPAMATSHDLEFSLRDKRGEPAIYLMDSPQELTLEVTNASPSALRFGLRSGVSGHEDEHHFELRLRAGVVEDLSSMELAGPVVSGVTWKLTSRDTASADYARSVYIAAVGEPSAVATLEPHAAWSFTLKGVRPVAGGGSRGTRVQLRWRNVYTPDMALDAEGIVGTRLHYLHLIHAKHPSAELAFPLHAFFDGTNRLTTGAAVGAAVSTNADVVLRIRHTGAIPLPMPSTPGGTPPTIRVEVPVDADGARWAATHTEATFVLGDASKTHWSCKDLGHTAEVAWTGQDGEDVVDLQHDQFPSVGLTISGLDPGALSGVSELVIRFANFLDLDDPTRTMPDIVQRLPLIKSPVHVAPDAPNSPDEEAMSSNGSVGVWNGGRLRFHSESFTETGYKADTPEASIYVDDAAVHIETPDAKRRPLALGGAAPGYPIPVGGIVMWSGSSADVPDGWHLCDGATLKRARESYTLPNMVDKFVRGARTARQHGGSDSVTLNRENLPQHQHWYYDTFLSEKDRSVPVGVSKNTTIPDKMGSHGGVDDDNIGYQQKRLTLEDSSLWAGHPSASILPAAPAPLTFIPAYYTICYILLMPGWTR